MKKQIVFYLLLLLNFPLVAQAPTAFTYQGIAMDQSGKAIANQQLGIQITIVQDSHEGEKLYTEIHQPTTAEDGHFTLAIGRGQATLGQFSQINWGLKRHFIAIAMDITGDTTYQFVGSSELLSVPYAFHATVSGNRQGPRGAQGANGPPGEIGAPGILPPDACCFGINNKGPKGEQGPQGPPGFPSPPGKSGLANLKKTGIMPENPTNGRIYLDDGTNREDKKVGLRYFDINKWVDL